MAYSAGLYLGFDFVDLVVLDPSKQRPRIIKFIRLPIYEDAVVGLQKDRMLSITLAVKKAFEMLDLKINDVNFCLPQEEVIVRRFSMPYIAPEERENAVRFEAQKYLPFKLDDTLSDFYIINESKTARKMEALFISIVSQIMEKYTNLFKQLKIKINTVDILPFALLRLFTMRKRVAEGETRVVVYVEKNSRGSVVIIKENNVYLVREVGFVASKDVFFTNILNNVRLSIDYFKRETKEAGGNNILICGDPESEGLQEYLKENMILAQIETFELTNEIEDLNDLSKKQLVAIGLAMAPSSKLRPKMKLWRDASKSAIPKGIIEYKPLIIEGVALVVVLTLLQIFVTIGLACYKKKLIPLQNEKMAMVKGITIDASQSDLLGMENKIKSQIAFLKNLAGNNRLLLTKKLNCLGGLLPEGAWLESFQYADEVDKARSLAMNGLVYAREEKDEPAIANQMLGTMKENKDFYFGFNSIKLTSLKRTPAYSREALAFSIECAGSPLMSAGMPFENSEAQPGMNDMQEMLKRPSGSRN